MSSPRRLASGGLIPTPSARFTAPIDGPLRDGPDVSWLPHCRVGDDQGQEGACGIFAFASWAEIMHARPITDTECVAVYHQALERLDRPQGSGLTFAEAFAAAHRAGWLPGAKRIEAVPDLDEIVTQPILAGYAITPAWDNVSPEGCLDHRAAASPVRGYHAVDIVAHGAIGPDPEAGARVYIENSWGLDWGWKGLGVMADRLHTELIGELWIIV